MIFMGWWAKLNAALARRDEPGALYDEARTWFEYRPNWHNLDPAESRIINRIINARKPR